MKLEWLGKYRELVGLIYRSANAYSALCKTEGLGDNIKISPYEVQILEFIMEYENENNNMTWFANKMGISTSTYSKYVNRLVTKGTAPPATKRTSCCGFPPSASRNTGSMPNTRRRPGFTSCLRSWTRSRRSIWRPLRN